MDVKNVPLGHFCSSLGTKIKERAADHEAAPKIAGKEAGTLGKGAQRI